MARFGLIAATVMCLFSTPGVARSQTVRVGASIVHGWSLGVDLGLSVAEHFHVLGVVRGLDEGLECLGLTFIRPCTADGVSFGLGMRADAYEDAWGVYAELVAGTHRYPNDDPYRMFSGGIGLSVELGPRGSLDAGYETRWIGATKLDGFAPVGPTWRRTHALRFAMGVRLG